MAEIKMNNRARSAKLRIAEKKNNATMSDLQYIESKILINDATRTGVYCFM
jgi:hypothetical protein